MKKNILITLSSTAILIVAIASINNFTKQSTKTTQLTSEEERVQYEKFLNEHEYSQLKYTQEEIKAMPKRDRPDLAWEQDYLATIASVDEGVGKVLDYLKNNGLAENTIVIYTTDQGFYLGEKGWFDKRYMYEESLAMPLLMKYLKAIKPGTIISDLTQNLDFAETFLDYANVSIPKDMQGKSLRPLVENTTKVGSFRDAVYYHYYDYPAFHMVKKHYGIRTKRYKLMHFYDDIDTWELYDLEEDPKEIHNQIDNPEYDAIELKLRIKLAELQEQYQVDDNEFKQAPKEKVKRAYKQFERLRGKTGSTYNPHN